MSFLLFIFIFFKKKKIFEVSSYFLYFNLKEMSIERQNRKFSKIGGKVCAMKEAAVFHHAKRILLRKDSAHRPYPSHVNIPLGTSLQLEIYCKLQIAIAFPSNWGYL